MTAWAANLMNFPIKGPTAVPVESIASGDRARVCFESWDVTGSSNNPRIENKDVGGLGI